MWRLPHALCRSELAREEPEGGALILMPRIIVNVFREQARSYRRHMDFL